MLKLFSAYCSAIVVTACPLVVLAADIPSELSYPVELNPIIISSSRGNMASGRVAENVVVRHKGRIQGMPARDLGEVLRYVPGVDMSIGGRFGQATSLSIHGSNSRDVLVMVDDIPFNTQLSGQASPTRIPVENVERVEVIRGASSSAWGSSLGGVVNVITKDVGSTRVPTGSVMNTYGEFATRKHSMDIAGKVGEVGYYLMDSYMDSDGARPYAPAQEQKTFGKFSLPVGDQGKVTGSFGYSGARVRQQVVSTNRINETPYIARYGKLRVDWDRLDASAYMAYKYNDQWMSTDAYNAATGVRVSTSSNYNTYHGFSINGQARVREEDMFVAGVDFDWQTIKSNNYLKTAKSVSMQAPYANYTMKCGAWDLIPGVRFDRNDRFGSQLSPSVGSVWHMSPDNDTQWRLKASRAFTAPPLMWIYNDDPALWTAPNKDLQAERAIVYETGATVDLGRWRMDVNLYRSDIRQGMKTVWNGGLGAYQKQNVDKIRRQGIEGQIDYKVSTALKAYVSGGYNHPVNRGTRDLVRSNGVVLQHLGMGVSYQASCGLKANLYGHYDRWDSLPVDANDRKLILDLKVSRMWKSVYRNFDLDVFLNVYNLTNSEYWTAASLPLVERYFEGGATVLF